jgi:hypothetical protein
MHDLELAKYQALRIMKPTINHSMTGLLFMKVNEQMQLPKRKWMQVPSLQRSTAGFIFDETIKDARKFQPLKRQRWVQARGGLLLRTIEACGRCRVTYNTRSSTVCCSGI